MMIKPGLPVNDVVAIWTSLKTLDSMSFIRKLILIGIKFCRTRPTCYDAVRGFRWGMSCLHNDVYRRLTLVPIASTFSAYSLPIEDNRYPSYSGEIAWTSF